MRPSPTVDSTLLPSQEDVRFYETHGWFIAPAALSEVILDSARRAAEEYHSGQRDRSLPIQSGFSDWRPGDGDGVRNNEFASLQSSGIRELSQQPILGAIAARLARTASIRLFDDQIVCKPPAGGAADTTVGWHTDHAYWSTCASEKMLTAWIPFEDTTEENGTLLVLDESHRWEGTDNLRGFNNPDLEVLEHSLGREIPESARIPLLLRKGQVSFHHSRLVHGSSHNHGSRERFAMAVHLQDEANHYRMALDSGGQRVHLPHDSLCRRLANGDPDYTDPDVFPVLWEEPLAARSTTRP